ncbi:NTP transferase domain-containing protein [Candidatus Poriferisodalis sp.]|uniref:NTP transferase domain-containing protein n=1 Tax=Candidatus Poriferisodalis sp. TaxID=3101277 RepID=UPI003B5D03A4
MRRTSTMPPDPMTSGPMTPPCAAVVLAAGAGTRMGSDLPKPLHLIGGRAMVLRVLDALAAVDAAPVVVVVGHGAAQVREAVGAEAPQADRLMFATQPAQLGTGDAARVGLSALDRHSDASDVLVLPGDTPLLRATTLRHVVAERRRAGAAASLLTAHVSDPTGYGRIVRDAAGLTVVEQRDATPSVAQINEINAGVYCFDAAKLRQVLPQLRLANAASEYYLPDAIGLLARSGESITAVALDDASEAMGVNDADQLAACEAALAARTSR